VSGDVIATKERTHDGDATKVQVVTLAGVTGTEGAYTFADVAAGAGAEAAALRVTLATESLAALETISVAAIAAGDNNIGNVDIVSLPASTNTLEVVGDAAHDAAAAGNPVLIGGYASATEPADTSADGDAAQLWLLRSGLLPTTMRDSVGDSAMDDANNALRVNVVAGGAAGGTSTADDADFTAGTTAGTSIQGVYESSPTSVTDGDLGTVGITQTRALKVSIASGGIAGVVEDAVAAGAEEGIMVLAVRRDAASSGVSADGDFAALSVTSDGSLRVSGSSGTTQYTEDGASAGAEALCLMGAVRRDTAASSSGTDGDYSTINVDASGRVHVNVGALPASTNTIEVVGDAAHDAAAAGNPVLNGAYASAAAPTDVSADADAVRLWALRSGALAVQPTMAGVLAVAGNGASGTGVQRVTIANDSTGILATVTNVATIGTSVTPGTAAANLGKAEDAAHGSGDTGVMSLAVRTDTAAASSGTTGDYEPLHTDSVGALWTRSTGELADDAAFTPGTSRVLPVGFQADETATDSVDEGDVGAARITLDRKQIVTLQPHTQGGLTIFRSLDIDETEEDVKTSAGQLYFIHAMNMVATARYLKFYNATAANVTVGTTTPLLTFPVPANSTTGAGFTVSIPQGIPFSTAISVACTTGLADNDTGAPGTSDVIINLGYM
jgi:hypothetical protein